MLVLIDLMEFKVIVVPELGVASSHGVGGFQQIVTKVAIAGFDHSGVFSFKITGLVLCPDKTGVLGNGCLRVKAADVANLGDDTGGVNFANAGNGCKGIGDDLKLLLNSLVQDFGLFF